MAMEPTEPVQTDDSGTDTDTDTECTPLVTIEGIDGSGKSTLTANLKFRFDSMRSTCEPSEQWTGKGIRKALKNGSEVHPITTFFLFMADRKHHIEEEIIPAQENGSMVVSDRFTDSTLAYQPVVLSDVLESPLEWMHEVMHPWRMIPDLTIYLDLPPEKATERMSGDETYEKEETLRSVYERYQEIKDEYSERYVVIDATLPPNVVAFQAELAIREQFPELL